MGEKTKPDNFIFPPLERREGKKQQSKAKTKLSKCETIGQRTQKQQTTGSTTNDGMGRLLEVSSESGLALARSRESESINRCLFLVLSTYVCLASFA